MKQTSCYTRSLAEAQERAASIKRQSAVLYRLYTEDKGNALALTSRYFKGATKLDAIGLYEGQREHSVIIEVLGTIDDLQTIVHLAGDIRQRNSQSSVLVTWSLVGRLDVTAEVA